MDKRMRIHCVMHPQAHRCFFTAQHLLFQGFFWAWEWEGTQVLVDECQAQTPRHPQHLRQLVA